MTDVLTPPSAETINLPPLSHWYALGTGGQRYSSETDHPFILVKELARVGALSLLYLQRGPYATSVKVPPGAEPLFNRRYREQVDIVTEKTVVPQWEFCASIGYHLPDREPLWVTIMYDGSVAVMDAIPE